MINVNLIEEAIKLAIEYYEVIHRRCFTVFGHCGSVPMLSVIGVSEIVQPCFLVIGALIAQTLRVVHHVFDFIVKLVHDAVFTRYKEIKTAEYQGADDYSDNYLNACVDMAFAFFVKQN